MRFMVKVFYYPCCSFVQLGVKLSLVPCWVYTATGGRGSRTRLKAVIVLICDYIYYGGWESVFEGLSKLKKKLNFYI